MPKPPGDPAQTIEEIAEALDRAEDRCPDAKRQFAVARRLLKRLGPEIEAQIRLGERRGYAPRKKPKAAKSVTGYSIEPSRKGPALAEHRSTGAAPFHCPKFAYDAVAKAIAAGPEAQKFEEIRESVAQILGQEPPVYWLRVATRFFCERGLLKHSRATFTRTDAHGFARKAAQEWSTLKARV